MMKKLIEKLNLWGNIEYSDELTKYDIVRSVSIAIAISIVLILIMFKFSC